MEEGLPAPGGVRTDGQPQEEQGGQRLQPNAPTKLPPRSSFYLGEVDNTVYVDLE